MGEPNILRSQGRGLEILGTFPIPVTGEIIKIRRIAQNRETMLLFEK